MNGLRATYRITMMGLDGQRITVLMMSIGFTPGSDGIRQGRESRYYRIKLDPRVEMRWVSGPFVPQARLQSHRGIQTPTVDSVLCSFPEHLCVQVGGHRYVCASR